MDGVAVGAVAVGAVVAGVVAVGAMTAGRAAETAIAADMVAFAQDTVAANIAMAAVRHLTAAATEADTAAM
jgi:hypothetical protein